MDAAAGLHPQSYSCSVRLLSTLRHLRAGSAGSPGGPACWRYSLAAHLLPSFWQQQHLHATGTSGAALGQVANQLSVWLMLGAETADASEAAVVGVISPEAWFSMTGRARGSGQGTGPGVHAKSDRALKSSPGLAGRAVLVGYRLFEAREYAAMQQLVRLVGGESPSEAGLQYILGLSIACSVHNSKAAPDAGLDAAVGHLFRAAAGLCNSEAGQLRLVLQLLRRQQQQEEQLQESRGLPYGDAETAMVLDAHTPGANGDSTPKAKAATGTDGDEGQLRQRRQQQQEAMLRLQFDHAVMMLFEQKGVKEGALAFARAALSVVDEAYGPNQREEKLRQQGAFGLMLGSRLGHLQYGLHTFTFRACQRPAGSISHQTFPIGHHDHACLCCLSALLCPAAHLWSSIFNMAFDLGLVEDAYTAALSNPQHELAEEKVRRLVLALVEQGTRTAPCNAVPGAGHIMLRSLELMLSSCWSCGGMLDLLRQVC